MEQQGIPFDDSKVVDSFVYEMDEETISMTWESNENKTIYNYVLEGNTLILGIDFGDGYIEWLYMKDK